MRRRFVTLDVFTDRRFAGNPLAVVLEPEGLDNAAMQAIAREFNLSETVFVLPPAESRHRARLRIFTPSNELPFAGHPTVGTAVLLGAIRDAAEACDIVLEEGIGPVRCRVEPLGSGCGFARFDLPKLAQEVGAAAASGLIATALGLEPDDIGFDGYVPAKWSAGNEFTFIPVRGRDAIQRSRPNLDRWEAAFGNAIGAFVFCAEPVEANNAFHARMFAPRLGIREDPATGSAVAALAGMVARRLGDGEHEFGIEQGYEMGRPSLITLTIEIRAGALAAGSVGGRAVMVSEGTIEA
ncbi:MAG: PhzF family phenazine biosynthesis protein [Xanthobacteraceae bacterium]